MATPSLALLGCGGGSGDAPASRTELALAEVIPLGKAWARSSINVSVFREQSILAVGDGAYLVAYVDSAGDLCLHHLVANGSTVRRILVQPRLSDALLADGHCSASLGLSPDRRLHVMYGAHDTLPYYASLALDDFLRLPELGSIAAEAWPTRMSYPQFYPVGGTLQMWFRADPATEVHRMVYDAATGKWPVNSEQILTPGSVERVYMNQLAVRGTRVALPWLYRHASSDDLVRNEGLWLAWSNDGGQAWTTVWGKPVTWPVSWGEQSALVAVPSDRQPLNQTSSRFGPDGRLYLTWYAKDAAGRHQIMLTTVAPNGQVLGSEAVSDSPALFELLGRGTLVLPLSRPQIVASAQFVHVVYRQDKRLVVASRPSANSPGQGDWRYLRLDVGDLVAWEPSISAMHWETHQQLVVYVQGAYQGLLDTGLPSPAQPASLYVFRELSTAG